MASLLRPRNALLASLAIAGFFTACAPTRAMCRAESECGARSACVAGRCQEAKGHARIQSARRVRVAPRRIECGARGARSATCPTAESLALEFAFALQPSDQIVEAYLTLCLAEPPGLELVGHVEDSPQVVLPGSSPLSRKPPSSDVGAARTRLLPGEPACPVRLDVLELADKWRRRSAGEGAAVVVWEGGGVGGTQVALEALEPAGDISLELYVR